MEHISLTVIVIVTGLIVYLLGKQKLNISKDKIKNDVTIIKILTLLEHVITNINTKLDSEQNVEQLVHIRTEIENIIKVIKDKQQEEEL